MARILVVDDREDNREIFRDTLVGLDHEVYEASCLEDGLKEFKRKPFDLVITDMKMPEIKGGQEVDDAGLKILEEIKRLKPDTMVIVETAYGTTEGAMMCIEKGAFDYLFKPLTSEEIEFRIGKALAQLQLMEENRFYREERLSFGEIMVGNSEPMRKLFRDITKVAKASVDMVGEILILGETGTGKELVSRAIHNQSFRRKGPFVAVNCAAIPETLLESELFGVRANYPGFHNKEPLVGKFELADGGTILLDEIGDMDEKLQAKVLRVLEDREVTRLGETKSRKVDVRIIAVTNQDLKKKIKIGAFREDLYYRLTGYTIHVPPLRERKDDIPLLVNYFLRDVGKVFTKEAMLKLKSYDWPGNVRQLKKCVKRIFINSEGNEIVERDVEIELERLKKEFEEEGIQEIPETPRPVYQKEDLPASKALEELVDKIVDLNKEKGLLIKRIESLLAKKVVERVGEMKKAGNILGVSQPTLRELVRRSSSF